MKVQGTNGIVEINIKGISEALQMIRAKGQDIKDGTDAKTSQAANFLQQEIQESIIGKRTEERSVDTGNFANSISMDKLGDLSYVVYTDLDYAKFLEYGTSRLPARNHFRNSVARNQQKIIEIIKSNVNV